MAVSYVTALVALLYVAWRISRLRWSMCSSSTAEARRRRYLCELLSDVTAPREPTVVRTAPSLLSRCRATRARRVRGSRA